MNTMTGAGRRMKLELGWPIPVLGAVCAVLAAMPVAPVPATISSLSVLLATVGIALYRHRPPLVTAAASVTAAGVSLLVTFGRSGVVDENLAAWLLLEAGLLLCLLVQAVRQLRGFRALPAAALVMAAVVLAPLRLTSAARASPWASSLAVSCFGLGLLTICSVALGLYLRSLDEAREESVRAARREQRLQLASDLHDWLGHELTGLVLEAQAARVAGRTPTDVERALGHIEEAGVRVLDSIDRALCWLRSGGEAAQHERSMVIADLPALVTRFEGVGPIAVELQLDEQVVDVRPEISGTVYRVVLEALTNVRRHAPTARQVSVEIRRNGAHLIVRVTNDGARRQALLRRARPGGTGLRGLAERVAALGGTSWAGPLGPAGWAVHVVLPVVP